MLVLCSFLLIKEKRIFRFDVSNLIIEAKEIMFKIFEFKELFFEVRNDCVFVLRFCLIEKACGCQISVHLRIEFYLEINIVQKRLYILINKATKISC